MRQRLGVALLTAVLGLLAAGTPAQHPEPTPSPSPKPTGSPEASRQERERLHLDVEKHVEKVLEEEERERLLRFEEHLEVKSRSAGDVLADHFKGIDLECGPTSEGAPTDLQSREFRPHPAPHADLTALAQALMGRLKGSGPDRYFLYRVQQGARLSYVVRSERIPATWSEGVAGAMFELIDGYPDLKTATTAWRRLERAHDGAAPPLWATSPCRPGSNLGATRK
jgi:hypothetical protein